MCLITTVNFCDNKKMQRNPFVQMTISAFLTRDWLTWGCNLVGLNFLSNVSVAQHKTYLQKVIPLQGKLPHGVWYNLTHSEMVQTIYTRVRLFPFFFRSKHLNFFIAINYIMLMKKISLKIVPRVLPKLLSQLYICTINIHFTLLN